MAAIFAEETLMLELFDRYLKPSLQILSELHIGHFNAGADRRNTFQSGLTLETIDKAWLTILGYNENAETFLSHYTKPS